MQHLDWWRFEQLPMVQFLSHAPGRLGQTSELVNAQNSIRNRHDVMITGGAGDLVACLPAAPNQSDRNGAVRDDSRETPGEGLGG